jgi:hypothetical protein
MKNYQNLRKFGTKEIIKLKKWMIFLLILIRDSMPKEGENDILN